MALDPDFLWTLTHREFEAFKYQWASARAEMLNLQANTDGVPFTIEDVLDPESRAPRVAEIKAAEAVAKMQAEFENFRLANSKASGKGGSTEGVPEWMLKMKRR
jgi:hypothetical protein